MDRDGVRQRIHAGEERAARRCQRLVRFKHNRELDQVVTPHPDQRPRARLRCNGLRMGKRIAEFSQRDQSITGRQIERLFRIPGADHHVKFSSILQHRLCMLYFRDP